MIGVRVRQRQTGDGATVQDHDFLPSRLVVIEHQRDYRSGPVVPHRWTTDDPNERAKHSVGRAIPEFDPLRIARIRVGLVEIAAAVR